MSEQTEDKKEEQQGAQLINGRAIAKSIRESLTSDVTALKEKDSSASPQLAVLLVGKLQDSATYVRMKTKACDQIGISHKTHNLDGSVTQAEVVALVQQLNADSSVHGILVQLPLPPHLVEAEVLEAIHPSKDVDGLHTYNNGELLRKGTKASLVPCTPKGCLKLIESTGVSVKGKHVVVVGRSNLVGKPTALLLLSLNATVTVCHSHTPNLSDLVKLADIVVVAIGKPEHIQGSWLKPGCVVIDVGITGVDDASKKAGYRLVGDVAFEEAKKVCSHITPVPGGVGPMTVAMLMENVVIAYKLQTSSKE